MYHARPPSQLILDGGSAGHAEAWRQWFSEFTTFLKTSGVIRGGTDVKSSLLLELIGPKGYDIFSAFVFDKDEDSKDFDKLVKKFNDYFKTNRNPNPNSPTVARYNFFTRNQEKGESIDHYVTVLRVWAQECKFEHLEDGLIKDRLVCGVWDESLRDTLLGTEDLTLEKAVMICQESEGPGEKATEGELNERELDTTSSELVSEARPGRESSKTGLVSFHYDSDRPVKVIGSLQIQPVSSSQVTHLDISIRQS